MGMVNIQIIYNLQLDVIIKFIEYKQGKQILKSFMGSKRKSTDIKKKKKEVESQKNWVWHFECRIIFHPRKDILLGFGSLCMQ